MSNLGVLYRSDRKSLNHSLGVFKNLRFAHADTVAIGMIKRSEKIPFGANLLIKLYPTQSRAVVCIFTVRNRVLLAGKNQSRSNYSKRN
jgi:hypothetical protein